MPMRDIRVEVPGTDISLSVPVPRGPGWIYNRIHGVLGGCDNTYWTDPGVTPEAWAKLDAQVRALVAGLAAGLDTAMCEAGFVKRDQEVECSASCYDPEETR